MTKKPETSSSEVQKELDNAEKQFETFDQNIKQMTLDRVNQTPIQEKEEIKLSQKDIENSKDLYLKPDRQIGSKEKFDEKFRNDYNFATEYVRFTPVNKEILGETIELWTKPFPGMPAQFWKIPSGKPVWGPRHLAERLTGCKYHRFIMQQSTSTGADGMGQYYGSMAVDTTIQRLDALPVSSRKSIFMGASSF